MSSFTSEAVASDSNNSNNTCSSNTCSSNDSNSNSISDSNDGVDGISQSLDTMSLSNDILSVPDNSNNTNSNCNSNSNSNSNSNTNAKKAGSGRRNRSTTTTTTTSVTAAAVSSKKESMSDKLKRVTASATELDFSLEEVRAGIEVDVDKARKVRAVRIEADEKLLDMRALNSEGMRKLKSPTTLSFDCKKFDFRGQLLRALGLDAPGRLDELDMSYINALDSQKGDIRREKKELFRPLLTPVERDAFQELFSKFVRTVVANDVYRSYPEGGELLYYQTFPCIRMVRPGEFSIGVHCDASYGFSIANINYYLPLTEIYGTNSLVIESNAGEEDWHPLLLNYGQMFRFDGARCLHFSPENTTNHTRISFDFRVIPESLWIQEHDHFTSTPGYYACCRRPARKTSSNCNSNSSSSSSSSSSCSTDSIEEKCEVEEDDEEEEWESVSLPPPDWRVGFPFEKKDSS